MCAAAVTAALTTFARPAFAGDETEGERLFREGRAALLEGRYAEACSLLEESQRLEPHTGTLLNVAACHERQGRVASAWVEYEKAATAARAEGQRERVRLAEERIAALAPRVPWLAVVTPPSPAADLDVKLDGASVQPVAWGKEMPVDPGAHVVTASARGDEPFEERFELREAEHRRVVVAALPPPLPPPEKPEKKPETVIVDPTPSPAAPPPEDHADKPGRFVLELGLIVAAMGSSAITKQYADGVSYSNPGAAVTSTPCGSQCTSTIPAAVGAVVGVNAFGGYAFSDAITLGVRLLAGPRVTRGGGSFVSAGPSLLLDPSGPSGSVRFGLSLLFGDAEVGGNATVSVPAGATASSTSPYALKTSLQGGFGAALELQYDLAHFKRGGLAVDVSPAFLLGSNGNTWLLPIGLLYRFR